MKKKMETQKLKQGISILYDMEINNYLMSCAIKEVNYKISSLGHKNQISPPKQKKENKKANMITFCITGALLGAAIGFGGGMAYGWDQGSGFGKFLSIFEYGFKFLWPCLLIGGIIGVVGGFIRYLRTQKVSDEKFTQEMDRYNIAIEKEEYRVQKETQLRSALLNQKYALETRQREACAKLNSFYHTMQIDSKFRNLIAIGYMDEYLRLGIATSLGGVDGLYNLVLNQSNWDKLHASQEEILTKLDQIIDIQHRMYGEIKSIEKKCDAIVHNTTQTLEYAIRNNDILSNIDQNTEIIAYNTSRIKREEDFQSFMMLVS